MTFDMRLRLYFILCFDQQRRRRARRRRVLALRIHKLFTLLWQPGAPRPHPAANMEP